MSSPQPDRILLERLRLLGRHGALPEEREREQPFEVSLEIEADLTRAAASDALTDTIDYGQVVAAVAALVAGESFELLEALAEAIAAAVLRDERALGVLVRVSKLRPPVPYDLESASVVVHRSR